MNWQTNDLLMEHYDRIKRFITYKAGIEQAEDLTQQVFLKANQSLSSFQNKSSLYTWLYSIASNTITSEARRAYYTKELPSDLEPSCSRFITTDFTKEVDFKIDLGTSLNKLDQIDREILMLRYIADYSFRDIAKLLKLNESTIKNRMYRCLGKIKNDLENWHVSAPFNPKQYIIMVNMLETGQSGQEFQQVTDDFMAILRNNFRRITSSLNFTPTTKIAYEIYPDQETMHPKGYLANESFVGLFGTLNVVKIVSPLNPGPRYDYHHIVQSSLGLYTIALTKQLNPQLPSFLLYGIGEYISQFKSRKQVQSRITSLYRQRELPSIQYLRGIDSRMLLQIRGSELSYTLIDFIVSRYGWDALHRLIRDLDNFEAIFQCTCAQFEVEWKQFLTEQYVNADSGSSAIIVTSEQPDPKECSLNILVTPNLRLSAITKHAKAFESAHSRIKVTVATVDFFGPNLLDRISGPHAADLVFWLYDAELSRQDLFADLLQLYKEDGTTSGDLYKPLTDMTTENGKLTAIPMSPQPLVVFYNKEWFNRANLPEPTGDWTWEQFLAVSAKLKEANTAPEKEIYGSAVPMLMDLFESLAQSTGGSVLSPDNNHVTGYLDSRPVVEAFSLLLKETDNQNVVKKVPDGTKAILKEMSSGNVGMCVGRIGSYPVLAQNRELKGRIGVAPLPRLSSGVRANSFYIHALSIVAASKQQQWAWKFIKEIVLNPEHEFQEDWSKQEMLSSRACTQKLKLNDDPGWKVGMDELNHAVKPVFYRNPAFKLLTPIVLRSLDTTLNSEAEVQREMSQSASKIDQWLDETNSR